MTLARADWTLHHDVQFARLPATAHSVAHHSADEFAHPHDDPHYLDAFAAYLRATEAGHMGRSDHLIAIAYHWIITDRGDVAEGRPIDAQGGATLGHNGDSRAYCLIGNFNNEHPTTAALDALAARVRADLASGHLIGGGHPTWGHRNVVPTACPGDNFYAALPHVRDAVLHGTPIPSPLPAPKEFDVQDHDITGHLTTAHGEWLQQADGGILTVAGDFHGSYPGLVAAGHADKPRRFLVDLEPRGDGLPGYVMTSTDAVVVAPGVVAGRYSFGPGVSS